MARVSPNNLILIYNSLNINLKNLIKIMLKLYVGGVVIISSALYLLLRKQNNQICQGLEIVSKPIAGIKNNGNTCFLNCLL